MDQAEGQQITATDTPARYKSMRWYDYITVNLFWFGLNIRNSALGAILMPYLVDLFVSQEIKNTALGSMRTAGLIVAMLVQPAAGLLSDRCMSRWGRRRPFLLTGVLLDVVLLSTLSLSWGYWSLFAAVLLLQFSANVSHGPLQGLIPDLVPEEKRGRAAAIKALFELLPVVIVAFTVAKLMAAGQVGWSIAFIVGALVITLILTLVTVHEEPLRSRPNTPLGPPMLRVLGMLAGILIGGLAGLAAGGLLGGLVGLAAWPMAGKDAALAIGVAIGGLVAMVVAVVAGVWRGARATLGEDARRRASFTWWVVNRLFFLAAVTSIQGYAAFFLMYAFDLTREAAADMTGTVMVVVGGFTLLSALFGGWLSDRVGYRRVVAASGIIAAVGTALLLGTLAVRSLTLTYAAACVIGLGTGLFTTGNWALGTRLVPPAEAGRYLGISNLAGAGAGMIGAGIGGPMADVINRYRPGLGYFVIFGCYALLFMLSTASLRLLRESGDSF